ncbi:MAG: M48 family metallopeptidase [Azospirillaceae bacterium]|nr:M48 family metallopeptidase [Azospirillaceae bacterium]
MGMGLRGNDGLRRGALAMTAGVAGALLLSAAAHAADFDPVAATQAYMDSVPAEARAKSDAYFEGGYWLQLWQFLMGVVVAALFLGGGWGRRLRAVVDRFGRFATPLFVALYCIISYVLSLPLTIYAAWFRERQYGLMNQGFGEWLGDQMISLALDTVALSLLAWGIYRLVRAAGQRWWIWATAVTMAGMAVILVLGPVFVMPLFNKYETMRPGPVREAILSMARSNEVPATDVYEFNASRQSNKISANVSGLLGTTRISLTDTLLQRCTQAEVKAVMGHEMGHYVLNHMAVILAYFTLIILVGYVVVDWAFARLTAGGRWGVTGLADVTGLPLVMLLFSAYFFVLTPVVNTVTRTQEAEADAFGLNLAREPDGFAQVTLKLAEYRKLKPAAWEEIVFYDHPSGYNRILRAMLWKAENPAMAPAAPVPDATTEAPKP